MNTTQAAASLSHAKKEETAVQLRGVSRFFDHPGFIRALTNVSLEVYRGEVFGLLGPRGSGKSTVARILAGWLSPSEGKARVFARSPRRQATRARVSYLPQNPAHAGSPFLVRVIAFLKDLVKGVKQGVRRESVSDKPNGRERLVAMKRIVTQKTRLVLLDEPFAALDANGCNEMVELIQTIAQQGRTLIVFSGSLVYAKEICDRLAILYRGELQASGTLQELLATRESLRFILDLLPDETAEGLLQAVRQEVGLSELAGSSKIETQKEDLPPVRQTEPPRVPQTTESDTVLGPLLKTAATTDTAVPAPTSSVNHELLAALTKPTSEEPPSGPGPETGQA